MAKFFSVPFAATGDKTVVPDATQPDGSVSYTTGFGFDYERPSTDPGYKPVPREGTNQLYFDITDAVGVLQRQGVADWVAAAQPYPINAVVRNANVVWRSLIANNNDTPAQGTSWTAIGVAASPTVPGVIMLASAAEMTAGTDAAKAATAKTVADSTRINPTETVRGMPLVATQAEANALTNDSKMLTPLKAGQALVGRLINVRSFDTPGVTTYTPTAGTNSVIVEVQGGGGGSGGVSATTAAQQAYTAGGGGGAYAKGRFTSGFNGVSITVGAGGAGGAAGASGGGNGGASSFGGLISAGGGSGSPGGPAQSGVGVQSGVFGGTAISGANIVGASGSNSTSVLSAALGFASASLGGTSGMGGAGSPGGGGDGKYTGPSLPAKTGSTGFPGIVIIWEYA